VGTGWRVVGSKIDLKLQLHERFGDYLEFDCAEISVAQMVWRLFSIGLWDCLIHLVIISNTHDDLKIIYLHALSVARKPIKICRKAIRAEAILNMQHSFCSQFVPT
jgi:hypothetical protein